MTIHVTRLGDVGDGPRIRTAAPGRVCHHAGCATRLSVYNALWFCAVHSRDAEEPTPAGHNRCPKCGAVLEWTPANFHRDSRGGPQKLHRICRQCRNAQKAQRDRRRRAVLYECKDCPCCVRNRPLTRRWWHCDESGAWSSLCRQCTHEQEPDP